MEAFEVWIWRRVTRISWTKHKTNEEMLEEAVVTWRELMDMLRTRQNKMPRYHRKLLSDNPNFGGVPVAPDRPCCASTSAWALRYSAVKLFSKYSNVCDHGT